MTAPSVETVRANLDRLLERREAALEGKGRAPDPAVIEAAERALEFAHSRVHANG